MPLIGGFYFDSLTLFFNLTSFWKILRHKKDILKLTDLYTCRVLMWQSILTLILAKGQGKAQTKRLFKYAWIS